MATHAGIAFAVEHPKLTAQWEASSNSLVVLAVRDEFELSSFLYDHCDGQCAWQAFYEPDINNELTAIALLPESGRTQQALKRLPLPYEILPILVGSERQTCGIRFLFVGRR